jgi:drug/metabolite transporter (DMT)-like permease
MTDNLRGAAWILLSCVFATGMTVGVRSLAGEIHSLQTAFGRSVIGLALVLPWIAAMARKQKGLFTTRHWGLHLVRSILGVIALNCGFYSLTKLPLAVVTILFFTTPLFVTLLAPLLLSETIGWRRWSATLVGFIGTLIVVQPTPERFDPNMLFALTSSLGFAVILLLGKRISATESPVTMMLFGSLLMTAFCLPPALQVWTMPSPAALFVLLLIGMFGTVRTYCDIKGFAVGEASAVAPFQYARLIFVAIAGYVLFDEVLETNDLIGAAVIFGSTIYIAHREARLKRPRGAIGPE